MTMTSEVQKVSAAADDQDEPGNSTLPRAFLMLAIVVTVAMGALLLARIFHLESSGVVVGTETFTPYALLPAFPVLIFALLKRQRTLAVVSALIILFHIGFVAPEWNLIGHGSKNAPAISLLSHNIMWDNPTPGKLKGEITSVNPDVVFFQEISPKELILLRQSHVLDPYRYSKVSKELGTKGIGVWSKFPLSDVEEVTTPYFPIIRGTITAGNQKIRFYDVHVIAPTVSIGLWNDSLDQLNQEIHAEAAPTFVAGDFNSVYSHRPYRQLLTGGFRDAHVDLARGFARTWPVNGPFASIGGVIRIDHVLTGPHMSATTIEEGNGDGSDHRSLIASLALT